MGHLDIYYDNFLVNKGLEDGAPDSNLPIGPERSLRDSLVIL